MAVTIQLRRDIAANWAANNPILSKGEMGIETDNLDTGFVKLKFGDGVSEWNSLPYFTGASGGTSVHGDLSGRSDADQHPISAITGLEAALNDKGQVDSVVAGANITIDNTDPKNPIVTASGGTSGGQVDSVVAGENVAVDSSDPANPVVSVDVACITPDNRTLHDIFQKKVYSTLDNNERFNFDPTNTANTYRVSSISGQDFTFNALPDALVRNPDKDWMVGEGQDCSRITAVDGNTNTVTLEDAAYEPAVGDRVDFICYNLNGEEILSAAWNQSDAWDALYLSLGGGSDTLARSLHTHFVDGKMRCLVAFRIGITGGYTSYFYYVESTDYLKTFTVLKSYSIDDIFPGNTFDYSRFDCGSKIGNDILTVGLARDVGGDYTDTLVVFDENFDVKYAKKGSDRISLIQASEFQDVAYDAATKFITITFNKDIYDNQGVLYADYGATAKSLLLEKIKVERIEISGYPIDGRPAVGVDDTYVQAISDLSFTSNTITFKVDDTTASGANKPLTEFSRIILNQDVFDKNRQMMVRHGSPLATYVPNTFVPVGGHNTGAYPLYKAADGRIKMMVVIGVGGSYAPYQASSATSTIFGDAMHVYECDYDINTAKRTSFVWTGIRAEPIYADTGEFGPRAGSFNGISKCSYRDRDYVVLNNQGVSINSELGTLYNLGLQNTSLMYRNDSGEWVEGECPISITPRNLTVGGFAYSMNSHVGNHFETFEHEGYLYVNGLMNDAAVYHSTIWRIKL